MNSSESHIDPRVELYVKGQLHGVELESFEAQLVGDVALQQLVAEEKAAFEFFVDLDVLDLKKTMEADLGAGDSGNQRNKMRWPLYLLIGCAGLGIGSWLVLSQQDVQIVETVPFEEEVDELGDSPVSPKPETQEVILENPAIAVNTQEQSQEVESIPMIEEEPIMEAPTVQNQTSDDSVIEIDDAVEAKNTDQTQHQPRIQQVEKQEIIVAQDPCLNVKFSGSIKTTPTGVGMESGEILVESAQLEGGQPPYTIYIVDEVSGDLNQDFEGLGYGAYVIHVVDDNKCEARLDQIVQVDQTFCSDDYEPTMNTAYQSSWKLPIAEGYPAHVTLINRVGQVLVDQDMDSNVRGIWNGVQDNGQPVVPGAYKWYITYDNGEKCLVKLTVLN